MPELPEVETVRLGLHRAVRGRTIRSAQVHSAGLRWRFQSDLVDRLEGRRITSCDRRGKYLLLQLSGGQTWITHLGMTGGFSINGRVARDHRIHEVEATVRDQHEHVTIHLSGGHLLSYHDARRFGSMEVVDQGPLSVHPVLSRLGPEPIDADFDAGTLAACLAGRRCSIKSAIMNQQIIAGIGNIYACESLHRAKISPRRLACTLVRQNGSPTDRCVRLAQAMAWILHRAIDIGGSTLRDFSSLDGEAGGFSTNFRAYDREGLRCRRHQCSGVIRRYEQSGRSTFACTECQR